MKCKHCGKEIAKDSVYCEFCGKKLVGRHTNLLIVLGILLGIGLVGGITALVIYQNNHPGIEIKSSSSMAGKELDNSEIRAELLEQGYVDLGLPSGTLWKDRNEEGYYTYDQAKNEFDNLPSKEQCEELKSLCDWSWTGSGYDVVGPNGHSIFLPAAGFSSKSSKGVEEVYLEGYYISLSQLNDEDKSWLLYFNQGYVSMCVDNHDGIGSSVRIVH